ncbi:hypothetical protein [Actinomadura harenae]|uniref:Uncharacterized protein n=1 Tax=Actinomadura harenae TaxID=2483351 RepID=A0A3M2LT41_9ACTN|nr:hypothetical protein [Actinomadura harenae]RMI40276.1 hypothetical protein EBO15_27000 [Actinomadura harenae]
MNGRGVSRNAALTLLLGTLLAGLFLMHGLSASPSPIHFSDPVQVSAPGMTAPGMTAPGMTAPGMTARGTASSGMAAPGGAGHHAPDATTPARAVSAHAGMLHDMGGCLGGTVCLALLVFGVIAIALTGRSVALLPARLPSGVRWTRRRGPPSARPPDLHRLCVMRL